MKQRLLEYRDGRAHRLAVDAPGAIRWVAWDREDGSALLVGDGGTVLQMRGSEFRTIQAGTRANLRCIDFHPDGGTAFACGNSGTVLRVDSDGGTSTLRGLVHDDVSLRRVKWNSSGDRVLLVGNGGSAYLVHYGGKGMPREGARGAAGREPAAKKVTGAETNLRSIAWHPRSDLAIVTGNCFRDSIGGLTPSPNLFELRGEGLSELSDLEESRADLTAASWHPDGSSCLITGFDQTWHTSVLFSYSPDKLTEARWSEDNLFPTACSWNPSGDYALIGTTPLTADEGPAALYRYEAIDAGTSTPLAGAKLSVSRVADLKGFGVSCIAWRDEETAMIACSRHVRAYSS